jgi:hypothetical protein
MVEFSGLYICYIPAIDKRQKKKKKTPLKIKGINGISTSPLFKASLPVLFLVRFYFAPLPREINRDLSWIYRLKYHSNFKGFTRSLPCLLKLVDYPSPRFIPYREGDTCRVSSLHSAMETRTWSTSNNLSFMSFKCSDCKNHITTLKFMCSSIFYLLYLLFFFSSYIQCIDKFFMDLTNLKDKFDKYLFFRNNTPKYIEFLITSFFPSTKVFSLIKNISYFYPIIYLRYLNILLQSNVVF